MNAMSFKLGNTTIKVLESTPNESKIRELYELCNQIFADKPECFYTREETRKLNLLLAKEK